MRKLNLKLNIFATFIFLASCTPDLPEISDKQTIDDELLTLLSSQSPTGKIDYFIFPESDEYAKIPQDPKNPLSQAKTMLGAFLFHETGLSSAAKDPRMKGTFSCASCHHAGAGFQAGVLQGIGEGGNGFGKTGKKDCPKLISQIMMSSPSAPHLL